MENKQKPAESERSSICSDLEQMNLADFALDEFEAKSNDGNVGEIEKIKAELAELKKEMEAMKLASKSDSNENQLEKYLDEQLIDKLRKTLANVEKLVENETKIGNMEMEINGLKMGMENMKKMMEEKSNESMKEKLAKMEEAMAKLKEEIDRKNEQLAEKDAEICALKKEIGQKDQKLAENDVEIYRIMGETDEEIYAVHNEISALKEEIDQKDQKLADQEAKIVALENQIAKQKKAVDQQSTIGNAKIERLLPPPPVRPTKAPNSAEDANKTELKKAYPNVFGYCASCEQGFLQTDWARQIGDLQYHVDCFKCDHCRRQLLTGEEFSQDSKVQRKIRPLGKMIPRILCKKDYMELVIQKKLPPVNVINSSNAKPTKTPTATEDVNKTKPKKTYSNFSYWADADL